MQKFLFENKKVFLQIYNSPNRRKYFQKQISVILQDKLPSCEYSKYTEHFQLL